MEQVPQTPTEVLLMTGIVLLIGLVVYGGGLANGLNLRTPPLYRWVGVGFMVLATVIGFTTMMKLFNGTAEFYRAMIPSRKVLLAHYVGFVAPFVLLACVPLAEFWFKRSQRDML